MSADRHVMPNDQPLFDRIRELNAEVALLQQEAREDRAELRAALAATPAPLDGLRAALDGVMSRVRLDLVSGGTDQRYSPAEVAVLVRQAVEGTYVAIAAVYAEETK